MKLPLPGATSLIINCQENVPTESRREAMEIIVAFGCYTIPLTAADNVNNLGDDMRECCKKVC